MKVQLIGYMINHKQNILSTIVASIVTLSLNYIFFRNEFKEVIKMFKNILKGNKKAIYANAQVGFYIGI